jgi:peptidyl-prolyl cis-trans isomerase A (cyclophilin A)
VRLMRSKVLAWIVGLSLCTTVAAQEARVAVVLETPLGAIELAIDIENSPLAANYWLGFVDRGQYDGATLYRSGSLDGGDTPQLVQGGLLEAALISQEPVNPADYGVQELLVEWDSARPNEGQHRRGTIGLVRDLLQTGSVIPEIVFTLRDAPSMNEGLEGRFDARGFPVIGEVTRGIEIIEEISRLEANGATSIPFLEGEILTVPVEIVRAYRQASATTK